VPAFSRSRPSFQLSIRICTPVCPSVSQSVGRGLCRIFAFSLYLLKLVLQHIFQGSRGSGVTGVPGGSGWRIRDEGQRALIVLRQQQYHTRCGTQAKVLNHVGKLFTVLEIGETIIRRRGVVFSFRFSLFAFGFWVLGSVVP